MLKRNENGKLRLSSIDLQIFMGDLFAQCKDEKEVEWLKERIEGCNEKISEERIENL